MNRYSMNRMIEYIRAQDEFPFDVLDVEEELDAVLAYFGFFPALNEAEREEVTKALSEFGGAAEWSEIARWVNQSAFSPLACIDSAEESRDVFMLIQLHSQHMDFEDWLDGISGESFRHGRSFEPA